MMIIFNLKVVTISFFVVMITLVSNTEIRAQNSNIISTQQLESPGLLQLEPQTINIAINKAQAISTAQRIKEVNKTKHPIAND